MNATGAFLTFVFSAATVALPRRLAALAFVAATLYITQGQAVDLGLNMMAIRFVEVAAIIRVLFRRELRHITFTVVDRWLIIFPLANATVFCLREQQVAAYEIGLFVDAALCYFCFRAFIRDFDDFTYFIKGSVLLLVPFAGAMAIESQTGRNLFVLMGGVGETPTFRDGHYRCQASFRHAITAGSVGATFFPLYISFFLANRTRILWWIGMGAAVVIVVAAHSSGPLMAFLVGVVSWLCWPVRRQMAWVRRGIVAMLVFLHLAMSSPVWFVFDRISGLIGGDGWHRSNLIDKFLRNFGEWAIMGMPFEATSTWAATQMPWGGVDCTNYYVSIGISGGLISLAFLFIFIVAMFKLVGKAAAILRSTESKPMELVIWGLGAAFCAHVINITAVIYWDQSYVVWYLHAAVAAGLSAHVLLMHSVSRSRVERTVGEPTHAAIRANVLVT